MPKSKPRFNGFTMPDGAWLPPELLYLLPYLTKGQLKCTIAAIYHFMTIGGHESLSISDFQRLTGLARQSVITALRELTQGEIQTLERHPMEGSYIYIPRIRIWPGEKLDQPSQPQPPGLIFRPPPGVEIAQNLDQPESVKVVNSDTIDKLTDSTLNPEVRLQLIEDLRDAGIWLQTAQRLVEDHPAEEILDQLKYYKYALRANIANGPGYLATSIKESWGAPLGYSEEALDQPEPELQPAISQEAWPKPVQDQPTHPSIHAMLPGSLRDGSRAWEILIGGLVHEVPRGAFQTWIDPTWLYEIDQDGPTFVVACHNSYARDWLTSRMTTTIERQLAGICNVPVKVRFVARHELSDDPEHNPDLDHQNPTE